QGRYRRAARRWAAHPGARHRHDADRPGGRVCPHPRGRYHQERVSGPGCGRWDRGAYGSTSRGDSRPRHRPEGPRQRHRPRAGRALSPMTPIGQARTIVLASPDPLSGKSAVAIGLLAEMRQQFRRVAVFRPIVRSDGVRDHVLVMLLEQLGASQRYADAIGVNYDQMIADPGAAMTIIVEKANLLSEYCHALLVVGSDYTDVAGPMEFGFDAEVAASLGAPIILVVSARHRSPELVA